METKPGITASHLIHFGFIALSPPPSYERAYDVSTTVRERTQDSATATGDTASSVTRRYSIVDRGRRGHARVRNGFSHTSYNKTQKSECQPAYQTQACAFGDNYIGKIWPVRLALVPMRPHRSRTASRSRSLCRCRFGANAVAGGAGPPPPARVCVMYIVRESARPFELNGS